MQMSIAQTRSLTITGSNAATYLSKVSGDAQIPLSWESGTRACGIRKNNGEGSVRLTAAAMGVIYPNATAHPTSMTFSQSVNRLSVIATGDNPTFTWSIDGTEIIRNGSIASGSFNNYSYTLSGSAVTDSQRGSQLVIWGQSGTIILINTATIAFDTITVSADFTQYVFGAYPFTAGIGSVSVSSPSGESFPAGSGEGCTGYEGDTVTFSADVLPGYRFMGWYRDTARQSLYSSAATCSYSVPDGTGSNDLTLYAFAIPDTRTAVTRYNGTQIASEAVTPPVSVSYDGTQIASLSDGETVTLECDGTVMRGHVRVGSKTLLCGGKRMNGKISVTVS